MYKACVERVDVDVESWVIMCVIIICLTITLYVAMTANQLDDTRDVYCDVFIPEHLLTVIRVQNGGSTC
jgi:hypothetical protein